MATTYFSTGTGVGKTDGAVPAGSVVITQAAYDAAVAGWTASQVAAVAEVIPLEVRSPLRPGVGAWAPSWDDAWDSHDEVARMHADRDQRATFYITTNLLDTTQHLPTSALLPIQAMGHEIGCHNADHIDMTGLTPTTRLPQWASQQTLEGIVGKPVRSYAYPLGNNNVTTNSEAYGRFDRVAAIALSQGYYTGASGYGPYLYEPGWHGFEGFKHGRFPWSQQTHSQFMQLLQDYVAKRGGVLTSYAHQIGNSDTPTLAMVTEAMDFCAANGIPCIRADEAFPAPKVINPGFENSVAGWTIVTAGAATAGTTIDVIDDPPVLGLPGTKSLRIISPNTATSGDSVHVFQTIPVRPLTAYTLSGRVRYDAGVAGVGKWSVRINEFNEAGNSIASRSVRGSAAGAVWTQSTATPPADAVWTPATLHTHPDTRYMTVGFYLQELTGTFYADHLYFGPTEEGLLG